MLERQGRQVDQGEYLVVRRGGREIAKTREM
jgi:hypothetical protein